MQSRTRGGRSTEPEGPEPHEVPRIGEDDERGPRDRTALRRDRVENEKVLADLVRDLIPLSEQVWSKLALPDETVSALLDGRNIQSHAARARHLRLIRSTLRDADWHRIRRDLDLHRAGLAGSTQGPLDPLCLKWCEDLIILGEAGLARFMEEYPDADRRRLRALVRNVKSAKEGRRAKSRLDLERALQEHLAPGDDDS